MSRSDSNPVLSACHVTKTGEAGIHINDGGRGVFDRCTVSATNAAPLHIGTEADPLFLACEFKDANEDPAPGLESFDDMYELN